VAVASQLAPLAAYERMHQMSKARDSVAVKGFFRLQIKDNKTGRIDGDTGWIKNQITNYGYNSCIVALPFKCAGSIQCSGMMLGSGTGVASDGTNLTSKNTDYWGSFAQSTVIDSSTCRATAAFEGSDGGAATLQEIGVFGASDGTVIAAKSFASSALATTQSVNCTYELRYS
jgi:hypothetical protein